MFNLVLQSCPVISIYMLLFYTQSIDVVQIGHITSHTDHTREPVGHEFINRRRLYTSKRLPTTHTAYSITNSSGGSTVCHVSHTQLYSDSCLMSPTSLTQFVLFATY